MKTEVNIVKKKKKTTEIQNERVFVMTAVILSNDFSTTTMLYGHAGERITNL